MIITAIVAVIAVCAVAGAVYFFVLDQKGISGTYIYEASGEYSPTETYDITWVLAFDNGKVTNSTQSAVITLTATGGSSSTGADVDLTKNEIKKNNPGTDTPSPVPVVPQVGNPSHAKERNSMINGSYEGKGYVNTNWGTMYLFRYGLTYNSEYYTCYCNDDGVIYLLENGPITYKLVSQS